MTEEMELVAFKINKKQREIIRRWCELARIEETDFYRMCVSEKLERLNIV